MSKGWIKLARSLQEHWLFLEKRKFSRFEAWVDILLTVNHTDAKVLIKGSVIECKRGQSLLSLESWGKRWKWDKSAVRRFLLMLENDSMIATESVQKTTRLTVCNYDSYQGSRNNDETQTKRRRNDDETLATPNKNDKNKKNERKGNNTPLPPKGDDSELAFDLFWNRYDKKVDRVKCERKWYSLKAEDKKAVLDYLPAYLKATPDKQYRKNPSTFLNNHSWENELPGGTVVVVKKMDPKKLSRQELDMAFKNGKINKIDYDTAIENRASGY